MYLHDNKLALGISSSFYYYLKKRTSIEWSIMSYLVQSNHPRIGTCNIYGKKYFGFLINSMGQHFSHCHSTITLFIYLMYLILGYSTKLSNIS